MAVFNNRQAKHGTKEERLSIIFLSSYSSYLWVSGFWIVFTAGDIIVVDPVNNRFVVHGVQHESMRYEQIKRAMNASKIVHGFNYSSWSTIHKFAASFLFIVHDISHPRSLEVV